MQLGQLEPALQTYDRAERLAPGWYRLSTEAWLAREVAANRLLQPAWVALVHLESGRSTAAETLAFAVPILRLLPRLAVLHFWYGVALQETAQPGPAQTAFRAALAHAGEANLKTRALLKLSFLVDEPERSRLRQEAVELNGHLPSAVQARWLLESTPGWRSC